MKHRHSHIALLLIAVAITVFVFALYAYMHFAVSQSLEKALSARALVTEALTGKGQKQALGAIYNDTAKDRASLVSHFIPDDQKVKFIEKIESFGPATQSELSISGIAADDLTASEVGAVGHISMHIDASGNWSSVMRVLELAETLPYRSSVSGVRLEYAGPGEGKDAVRSWHVTFVLDAMLIKSDK